ncbi:MAG: hypothetical protein GY804_09195 [Alphaproteobacteria bacterium]|nr:hypothetical protein [Alphaproteobacteria bacterium]
MPETLSNTDIGNMIKELVEYSSMAKIQEDLTIIKPADKKPWLFNNKECKIFGAGLTNGDYLILNPFRENLKLEPQQKWLYNSIIFMFDHLMIQAMLAILKMASDKDAEPNEEQMPIISKIVKKCNKSAVAKARKVLEENHIVITSYYSKKERIFQYQTRLFDDDLRKEFGKSISKKSWELLTDIFTYITQVDDFHKEFQAKSTSLTLPRFSAFIPATIKLIEKIKEPVQIWLGTEITSNIFIDVEKNMKVAQKMTNWISSSSGASKIKSKEKAPWDNKKVPKGFPMGNNEDKPKNPIQSARKNPQKISRKRFDTTRFQTIRKTTRHETRHEDTGSSALAATPIIIKL